MNTYRKLKTAALVGAALTAAILIGCGGKTEEVATTPANPTGAGGTPTTTQMPPEVKTRMDQQQTEAKARADAQGKAMMQNQQGAAPK